MSNYDITYVSIRIRTLNCSKLLFVLLFLKFTFRFPSFVISSYYTVIPVFLHISSLSLGNISKQFFLTYSIFFGSSLSLPLPLTLDLKWVSLSNNSFTSAVANDLILYVIIIGHKIAGLISSSSYTENKLRSTMRIRQSCM